MLYDTQGNKLNAHGAGVLKINDRYFLYGEHYNADPSKITDGISCYSSTNLVDWKFEGVVLPVSSDSTSLLYRGCRMERPKVLYNEKNDNYVMWFHHELAGMSYNAALTGLAISESPSGPFNYVRSTRVNANTWPINYPDSLKSRNFGEIERKDPRWKEAVREGLILHRDFEKGQMSRDMTLFQLGSKAYHIHSSEENQTLHIAELNDDFTDFTGKYARVLPGGRNEAPAIMLHNDQFFMITSGCTGWKPNAARLSVADSIMGEWTTIGNPVVGTEEEMKTTFHSQSTFLLTIEDQTIFLADRWNSDSLANSEYVWLPVTFNNNTLSLAWNDRWSINQ